VYSMVYVEEYDDLNPAEVPISELKELINKAKEMKDSLLQSLMDSANVSELVISAELKNDASAARTGFIKFIKDGNKELKTADKDSSQPSSANTSTNIPPVNKT